MAKYCKNCIEVMSETGGHLSADKELLNLKVRSHPFLIKFHEENEETDVISNFFHCKECSNNYIETFAYAFLNPKYDFEEIESVSAEMETILKDKLSVFLYLEEQVEHIKESYDFSSDKKVTLYQLIGANIINGKSRLKELKEHGYNLSENSLNMMNVHFSFENLVEQENFNPQAAQWLYVVKFDVPLNKVTLEVQNNYYKPVIEAKTDYKIHPSDIIVMQKMEGKENINLSEFYIPALRDSVSAKTFLSSFTNMKKNIMDARKTETNINSFKETIQFTIDEASKEKPSEITNILNTALSM